MELSPQQDVYYIDTVSPIDYFIDTVTPSAIQLNKEKTMSIELDGPLYLGSNSLQQQVDQNTEDITELQSDVSSIEGDIGSLDNLATSDKSSLVNAINETLSVLDPTQTADYIKNSKGLESGEISTNASILPWVEEMKTSTFDRSKFNVVGSPNITDDGIASGFSDSNYLKTPSISSPTNSLEILIFTHFNNYSEVSQSITGISEGSGSIGGIIIDVNRSGYIQFALGSNATSRDILALTATDEKVQENIDVYLKLTWSGTVYKLYRFKNGSWIEIGSVNSTVPVYISSMVLGNRGNLTVQFGGSIDLKQFSITVDGVPVFSGNKTGIDTIKADDYTGVGTPTISADGIYQAVSGSDYAYHSGLGLNSDDGFKLYARICPKSRGGNSNDLIYFGNFDGTRLWVTSSYIVELYYHGYVELSYNASSLGDDEWVDIFVQIKKGKTKFRVSKTDGTVLCDRSLSASLALKQHNTIYFGRYDSANYNTTKIDLNTVRICDMNDNLVYQPCLKIPYTKSKTGCKVVNAIYRDRVNDMADQFGYANYYTLSDTDFTLPQVELYGLIGQRTLRDSYRNGINYWELYSNRDLEQGGSCTSGVEVTFARPFADTNYVLSVPYSAKSSMAFTPTQTGDWIAKGKGIL